MELGASKGSPSPRSRLPSRLLAACSLLPTPCSKLQAPCSLPSVFFRLLPFPAPCS